jgi:hypothetical protein
MEGDGVRSCLVAAFQLAIDSQPTRLAESPHDPDGVERGDYGAISYFFERESGAISAYA